MVESGLEPVAAGVGFEDQFGYRISGALGGCASCCGAFVAEQVPLRRRDDRGHPGAGDRVEFNVEHDHAVVTAREHPPRACPALLHEPRSPWQRPTNEHTNGLLRRWLPKGTNLDIGQLRLAVIEDNLNHMPRRLHHWQSAADIYTQLTCNHR